MKVDLGLLCDYALVDQSGKISMLGIFQHIWMHQFPGLHPRLHLVLRISGTRQDIGEHKIFVTMRDDRGKEILGGGGTITFSEPPEGTINLEAAAILVFDAPFSRPGAHRFEIVIGREIEPFVVPFMVAQMPDNEAGGCAHK